MWYFLTFLGGMVFATIVLFIIGSVTLNAKRAEMESMVEKQQAIVEKRKAIVKKNKKGISKKK